MLRKLVITNEDCVPTDFSTAPWNSAALVTPRHAVRMPWNEAAVRRHCVATNKCMFICPAEDTVKNRSLNSRERRAVAESTAGKNTRDSRLPTRVQVAVGMKVMVTANVQTDLDIANGSRGEIIDIILDADEPPVDASTGVVILTRPPAYILVKLERTRMGGLDGLEAGVVPIVPSKRAFKIQVRGEGGSVSRTVTRRQYPMTPAYAFPDYRAQGQTIPIVIIDIAQPPSGGGLTQFSLYVALSRSSGRDTIRLLRDFDEKIFSQPLDDRLEVEDARLERLDVATKSWWDVERAAQG